MQDSVITTGVDSLIDLLKKHKMISIEQAAKELHVKESVLHTWADFLIEEEIVGIEYKFVTPYIFLIDSKKKVGMTFDSKEEFFEKAKARNLALEQVEVLWKKYLDENMDSIRSSFYEKSLERGVEKEKIEELWVRYRNVLLKDGH